MNTVTVAFEFFNSLQKSSSKASHEMAIKLEMSKALDQIE